MFWLELKDNEVLKRQRNRERNREINREIEWNRGIIKNEIGIKRGRER